MKRRLSAVFLALALCMGLAVPAFAVDIKNAAPEDIKSTFTIMRNGTIDETKGRYTSSKMALLDLMYTGTTADAVKIPYAVYDENDSWTITNTGSKAISANGSTDYTIDVGYVQYGDDPWDEMDAFGEIGGSGMLGLNDDGNPRFVYGGPPERPVRLKAGESITIPASALGESPAREMICAVIIFISYGGESGEDSALYSFYFGYDPAEKAAIDQNLAGTPPTFSDVPSWCADHVAWAASNDITNGTGNGKFSPSQDCTHAQILTFLYRADRGGGTASAADMELAVQWAREQGMIDGSFDGSAFCTRADAATYIWQAFGKQDAPAGSFTDVPTDADCAAAVNWAVSNGIVEGYPDGAFRPSTICSRGVIVTMLHRAYVPSAR